MPDFVTLSCPSCGAKLQIAKDVEAFACGYCGNEHVVHRTGGIVSLVPVVAELKKVSAGVDKTASELAIQRLRDEIRDIRAGMPKGGDSLSKIAGGLIVFAIVIFIGGLMTGEAADIFGAILVAGACVGLAFWFISTEDKSKRKILKPYLERIAQKQKELDYHEGIVKR